MVYCLLFSFIQFLILIFGRLIRTTYLVLWEVIFSSLIYSSSCGQSDFFKKEQPVPGTMKCAIAMLMWALTLCSPSSMCIYVSHHSSLYPGPLAPVVLNLPGLFFPLLIQVTSKSFFLPKSCLCLHLKSCREKAIKEWILLLFSNTLYILQQFPSTLVTLLFGCQDLYLSGHYYKSADSPLIYPPSQKLKVLFPKTDSVRSVGTSLIPVPLGTAELCTSDWRQRGICFMGDG